MPLPALLNRRTPCECLRLTTALTDDEIARAMATQPLGSFTSRLNFDQWTSRQRGLQQQPDPDAQQLVGNPNTILPVPMGQILLQLATHPPVLTVVHRHRVVVVTYSLPFPSSFPLLQSPNSYFMDVRCPGCLTITTVFSHATTVVMCSSCALMLCQPTGGKARLTEGCSFRTKKD